MLQHSRIRLCGRGKFAFVLAGLRICNRALE